MEIEESRLGLVGESREDSVRSVCLFSSPRQGKNRFLSSHSDSRPARNVKRLGEDKRAVVSGPASKAKQASSRSQLQVVRAAATQDTSPMGPLVLARVF